MKKVIKGEFEKLDSIKISDVSLTCNTLLEIFNEEVNRMSRMEDDLFTYEVEIAKVTNIPCDLKKEDDLEQKISHESKNDMEYDPFDVKFTEWAFKEFNYLLQIDPDVLTKYIDGFKTYEEYKDDWIYEWNKDVPWMHERPWTKNGDNFDNTNRDNDESENEMEHGDEERYEVFDDHERQVCYIRRFEMVKYSFKDEEEYMAIKENKYDDLTNTSKEAIHTYQEIFRMMDERWMVTHTE
nr:hypothetical protein [Tanacetum cinerariifolium]GEW44195.1 hypothetical protein [Tanacetum cinerariifolium]